MTAYALGEIFFALRAVLPAKGQAAADAALLQAALRSRGDAGNVLRMIAGLEPLKAHKPKLELIDGGAV